MSRLLRHTLQICWPLSGKNDIIDMRETCIWVRSQRRRHRNTSLCRYPKKSIVLLAFLATPQCFYKYTTAPTWDGPTVLPEPRHVVSMVTTYSRRNSMCGEICVRVFVDYYGLNVISRYDVFLLAGPNRELKAFGVKDQVRLYQSCKRG